MPVVSPEVALAVGRKKLRYARYVDTKNWDAFEKEVSRPETRYDYQGMDGKTLLLGPTTLRFSCTRDFRRAFETGFAPLQTQHIVAPGDFEQWADDEVRAIFAFEDQLIAPPFGIVSKVSGYREGERKRGRFVATPHPPLPSSPLFLLSSPLLSSLCTPSVFHQPLLLVGRNGSSPPPFPPFD